MSGARALTSMLLAMALALSGVAPATAHAPSHVSLPVIERQAMCVTCKVALNESQSPQADLERTYIKELIAKGQDEAEIKRSLVAQFGPTVLGLPSAHGFDLAVYLVPGTIVLILSLVVLLTLPRWRRRARQARASQPAAHTLSPPDAARLDADLARFD
jgi:cytochrome c-type biogenesis protein CcmH/NrfF